MEPDKKTNDRVTMNAIIYILKTGLTFDLVAMCSFGFEVQAPRVPSKFLQKLADVLYFEESAPVSNLSV
jgi:hypothetical protein